MGGGDSKGLLKKIDDGKGNVKNEIEKLFKAYDKDHSGALEGAEFEKLIEDLTNYAFEQCEAKEPGHQYDKDAMRGWVRAWMDTSGDGRCTLEEMMTGVQVVLDGDEQ
eukprot:NODE_5867_length_548_cov_289.397566.p1 GENE.NODE_5867_length_548_cov_289.397566~~NODE_5867_length_548_cov_289.397566.p1  ORF type:complete len:108 (-),score=32.74 NODE_5867_length_548_cov_289.397566:98-421(-)